MHLLVLSLLIIIMVLPIAKGLPLAGNNFLAYSMKYMIVDHALARDLWLWDTGVRQKYLHWQNRYLYIKWDEGNRILPLKEAMREGTPTEWYQMFLIYKTRSNWFKHNQYYLQSRLWITCKDFWSPTKKVRLSWACLWFEYEYH